MRLAREKCRTRVREPLVVGLLRRNAMPFLDHAVEPLGFLHALEPTELDSHRGDCHPYRFIEGGQLRLSQCPGADQQGLSVDGIATFFGHRAQVANVGNAVQDVVLM